jgi:tRNA (guanine-N7-)-methyltransferase
MMIGGNSRFISSAQDGPHRDLDELVRRHMAHPFRKPIADYNREALPRRWRPAAWKPEAPLILDAGCGVGWSTQRIAETFPIISFLASISRLTASVAANRLPMPANALC